MLTNNNLAWRQNFNKYRDLKFQAVAKFTDKLEPSMPSNTIHTHLLVRLRHTIVKFKFSFSSRRRHERVLISCILTLRVTNLLGFNSASLEEPSTPFHLLFCGQQDKRQRDPILHRDQTKPKTYEFLIHHS